MSVAAIAERAVSHFRQLNFDQHTGNRVSIFDQIKLCNRMKVFFKENIFKQINLLLFQASIIHVN